MVRIIFLLAVFAQTYLQAQSSQIVATINGENISSDELLYAYQKNRSNKTIHEDSLTYFLNQYINFKLKVHAAKAMGLDTSAALRREVQSYQEQIPKPYLRGYQINDEDLRKMYEKTRWQIKASHLLIKVSPAAAPKDTLQAYRFLDSLRYTIKGSNDFAQLAQKYSEDGSAKNGGLLGWFTALQMVQPFEEVAFETPTQTVSEVLRTQYGYHLIYVHQKRKNRGALKTSHLFFDSRKGGADFAKAKAFTIYDSLVAGAEWDTLARKYSEDEGSKNNGGSLQWATLSELPSDYIDIAYDIKTNGSYSTPQQTAYGWHIVRLDDIRPPAPFEAQKAALRKQMEQAGRNHLEKEALLIKLKEENDFSWNRENVKKVMQQLQGLNVSSEAAQLLKDVVLFEHAQHPVTTEKFIVHLPPWKTRFSEDELWNYYNSFEADFILSYEDRVAAEKYPEYGLLLQEIEEGLLLFEIMQKKVWNKAASDSLALKAYYQENTREYMIDNAANCLIVEGLDDRLLEEMKNKNIEVKDANSIRKSVNEIIGEEIGSRLKIAKKTIKANELSNFDGNIETSKWFELKESEQLCFLLSTQKNVQPDLQQIKGQVMADFQNVLEQEWLSELQAQAKVVINQKALKDLVQQ